MAPILVETTPAPTSGVSVEASKPHCAIIVPPPGSTEGAIEVEGLGVRLADTDRETDTEGVTEAAIDGLPVTEGETERLPVTLLVTVGVGVMDADVEGERLGVAAIDMDEEGLASGSMEGVAETETDLEGESVGDGDAEVEGMAATTPVTTMLSTRRLPPVPPVKGCRMQQKLFALSPTLLNDVPDPNDAVQLADKIPDVTVVWVGPAPLTV